MRAEVEAAASMRREEEAEALALADELMEDMHAAMVESARLIELRRST